MRKHYLMAFTGLLLPALAFSQDSLQTTTLKEVVTSASRFEQSVIDVPRSVTVISKDVIEKSVYNSVGELLAKQSGIYVVGANQTPGTNQSLFLRGANSNQVAIMIDGTRITDPSSPNAATDLSELSLTNIERIEIIKGSHSTLYGGAAIGGVVNIITKKGAHPGFGGNISAQSGVYSKGSTTLSDNIGLNYAMNNGMYFNLSTFNQSVSGLNAALDNRPKGVYKTDDKDGFKKNDGSFKAGFKNELWDVSASYKRVTQHAEVDQSAGVDDDNAYVDFNRNLLNYNASYQFAKKWRATLLGSWSNSQRKNVNDSSKIDFNGDYDGNYVKGIYNGKIQTHEAQINADYGKIKGVVGGGFFGENMDFNTYYYSRAFDYTSTVNYDTINTSAKTKYGFGEINAAFGNFNVAVGSRYSHHSLFGSHWTYELNPSYKMKSLLFYGSLSQGFNPASLYQLYDPSQGYGAYTTRGNKNLKAEESSSIEIGIKKEFPSGNYFTASAYQTKTKNAIEYVYLWNKNTNIDQLTYLDYLGDTYLNAARQTVSGIELEGHVAYRKFYFNGNFTMLKGEVRIKPGDIDTNKTGGNHVQLYNYGSFVTNEDITISKLTRRPKANAYAELGYKPLANLGFNVMYRYAGSRNDVGYDGSLGPFGALNQYSVKNYSLMDVGATWQMIKNFTLTLKAENIFNTNYHEILGYQTRGRSVYLKLNVKW